MLYLLTLLTYKIIWNLPTSSNTHLTLLLITPHPDILYLLVKSTGIEIYPFRILCFHFPPTYNHSIKQKNDMTLPTQTQKPTHVLNDSTSNIYLYCLYILNLNICMKCGKFYHQYHQRRGAVMVILRVFIFPLLMLLPSINLISSYPIGDEVSISEQISPPSDIYPIIIVIIFYSSFPPPYCITHHILPPSPPRFFPVHPGDDQ